MLLTREFSRVAATFSSIRAMLMGLHEDVNTVGIMTAWNPGAKPAGEMENKRANVRLFHDLRAHKLGPIRVGGHFDDAPEGSYLIPNVSRGLMVELCGKYDQASVVYGEKVVRGDKIGFRFELLDREGQEAPGSGIQDEFWTSGDEAADTAKTNFSWYKGDKILRGKGKGESKPRGPRHEKPGQTTPTEKRFKIKFYE